MTDQREEITDTGKTDTPERVEDVEKGRKSKEEEAQEGYSGAHRESKVRKGSRKKTLERPHSKQRLKKRDSSLKEDMQLKRRVSSEEEKSDEGQSSVDFPASYLTQIKAIKDALKTTVADNTAIVKVVLVPVEQMITFTYKLGVLLRQLKEQFSTLLNIPTKHLQFIFEGKAVKPTETLIHLGVQPNDNVKLELVSLNPTRYPIKPLYRKIQGVHDVITVRVQSGTKLYQDITVEIERIDFKKPFLGGFRHKVTGIEYHNAGTQTVPKKVPEKLNIFSRETQTISERKKLVATTSRTSTQMTKIGVYVSNMTDKLLTPGEYFTAAQYHAKRLAAIIVLQKYYRRWHAINVVARLREQKRLRLEWEEQERLRKERLKQEWLRRDYERRVNPYSADDFELLFHSLERQDIHTRAIAQSRRKANPGWIDALPVWRQEQLDRIDESYTGAKRKAALCELLEKETQIIASIGRQRNHANNRKYEKSVVSFLQKCSAPKNWKSFDNKTTHMDTQFTIRARELQDIYNCIIIKDICEDERLDVLLTLKHTVKEHECKLTQDILELIDREVDLMMRGVKSCNLEGLRKRIATLFLQYIKTPLFNPEVARYLKVPQDPAKFYKSIYFCRGCEMYLPSTEFAISSTSYHVSKCRQCCSLDNEARQREAFLKYKLLLKQLYQTEADYEDDSKIAYLMQLQDLQYLIENIWASQSALSAWDDLYDLVTVRWEKEKEWAPWNCILLTKDEASAHLKMKNIEEGYEPVFIHRIKHKHILARNYFSEIPMMAAFLYEERGIKKGELEEEDDEYEEDLEPKVAQYETQMSVMLPPIVPNTNM